jgi:hypothetical protein
VAGETAVGGLGSSRVTKKGPCPNMLVDADPVRPARALDH